MRVRRTLAFAVALTALVGTVGCQRNGVSTPKTGAHSATAVAHRGLPERVESDGTTITVGEPAATHTFSLYEDPRCPYCKEFETTGGARLIEEKAKQGDLKIEYTMASFLDDRLGGNGSLRAVNALRAALDQGKFLEYHDILYANQPAEEVDGFTNNFLLELASKVPGLRGSEFDNAVRTMKYRGFVEASQKAYEAGGAPGTPTLRIDGLKIPDDVGGFFYDRDATRKVLGILFPEDAGASPLH